VTNFIAQALRGQPITVYDDGARTRSFCYVSDLVDGMLRLWQRGTHEPVNLGNPREMTILEFAKIIQALSGTKSAIEFLVPTDERTKDDPNTRRPDITRAQTLLGWEPQVTLEDGLNATIEYFRQRLAEDGA
jgi:nucleoside-diphosphate-sugar epimerase